MFSRAGIPVELSPAHDSTGTSREGSQMTFIETALSAGAVCALAATLIHAIKHVVLLAIALRGTKPRERPEILRALADWRRSRPPQPPEQ